MRTFFKIHLCNESMQILKDSKRFPILSDYLSSHLESIDQSVTQYLNNADTDEHMLEAEAFTKAIGNNMTLLQFPERRDIMDLCMDSVY